jgi:flavin reductase (DIM6/NTAB) family NADH-FMN oxidoreductase RutF
LIADVDLCRWFDRLAGDEPSAAPGLRAARSPDKSSPTSARILVTSAVLGAPVLAGAALAAACGVLPVSMLAVPAMIVFLLAPVSVLVVEDCGRRRRGDPATRSRREARPCRLRAGWSARDAWSGMEGGMWLLP